MIWHEGIQGRNDEDVSSWAIMFLRHPDYRNAEQIVIWADNCVDQLKNWTNFAAIKHEVNSDDNSAVSIVSIKYFADSYHHQIDQAMKNQKCLYNFQDFEDCILVCGIPVVMTAADFYDYKNNHGIGKDTNYPLLKDASEVKLKRGSTKIYWKTDHSEEVFQKGEFVTEKFRAIVFGDGLSVLP